jgi:hypothetical protein
VLKAVATPKHFDVFSGPNNAACPDDKHPDYMCEAGMLTQGGRPAPLAPRFHSIPTHFALNLHGI